MTTSNASNLGLGGAERVQQHCPGPPKALEVQSNKQKPGNFDDLQQLKSELQLCQGKLKGYEILGHLFQESKQECARYRMQNEELIKKIDSLTASHLYVTTASTERFMDAVVPSSTLNNSTSTGSVSHGPHPQESNFELLCATDPSAKTSRLQGSDDFSGPSNVAASSRLPLETGRGFSLTEVGAKTPAISQGTKSGGSSGSSSPSFVQISDTDVRSPASCSLKSKPSGHSSVTSAEYVAQMSADMSIEINQLTEQVKKLGQSGSNSSVQDLSADLIRAGVSVLKLQKQNRVQQVVIDKLNTEIAELGASNADKQRFIQQLQEEYRLLGDRVKQMEASRGKALKEAQTRILEMAEDPEDNLGGPGSTEWVEVAKHRSAETTAGEISEAVGGGDVVTATSMIEMELRRRVEKLSTTITELVAVNRTWDEHCREIEANHRQQSAAMQTRLTELQNRIDEYERSDQKRQLEFDNILLNCKQQREAEEMAKEEALDQLHRERQLRTEIEFKCIEFSRKTVELEAQLIELKNSQQVLSSHYSGPPQHYEHPMSAREQELCSQLVILQEQINVFKEDFDQERSDREAARSKMEMLRRQLAEARSQINALQSQLASANADTRATKNENEQWRQRFQKLTGDLETLRRQAQPVPQRVTRQPVPQPQRIVQPTMAQPQIYAGVQPQQAQIRRPSWTCLRCTLKNSGTSTSCSACGAPRSRDLFQMDVPVGDRTVAGLQDYFPYQPYSALVSRSLETDLIDDNK